MDLTLGWVLFSVLSAARSGVTDAGWLVAGLLGGLPLSFLLWSWACCGSGVVVGGGVG